VTIGISPCNGPILNLNLLIQGFYTGAHTMTPVLMNQGVSNNPSITDQITVELRTVNAPYSVVASTFTTLMTNGTASCNFSGTAPGNYYVVVKHRNGLQTWSANPVALGNASTSYNFTTASNKAYGDNMVEVEPGVWAFYSGDFNQDENLDLSEYSYFENALNNFLYGYENTDLNGDGSVDLLDAPMLEDNINNFLYSIHP